MTNKKVSKIRRSVFLILSAVSLLSILYLFNVPSFRIPGTSPRFPTPTPAPPFQVVNAYPPGGPIGALDPQLSLSFQISRPLNPYEYRVEISPEIPYILGFAPNDNQTLYIRPLENWQLNIPYEVKIVGSQEKIVFQYKVTFMPPEPNEEDRNFERYSNP